MTTDVKFEKNGFDIIRYLAAFHVMMLHYASYCMILSDQADAIMDKVRRFMLFFPGVVMLFAMSGFLISASIERVKTRKDFYLKRIFRMYPELWVCTLLNLVCVCILVPDLLDGGIIVWLVTQFVGIAITPACLKPFATGSINGALWTVFTEIQLYIVLGFIYWYLKKWKNASWMVFLLFLAITNLACAAIAEHTGGFVAKLVERIFCPYALWFFIGVFCYQKRQSVLPVLKRAFLPVLLAYLIFCQIPVEIPGYYTNIVTGIVLPLLVIGGGYCLPKVRLKCDFSYGMFLYHWLVLNIIVHFDLMNRLPWYVCLLLFITASLFVAWLSWWFVSRRIGRKQRSVFL